MEHIDFKRLSQDKVFDEPEQEIKQFLSDLGIANADVQRNVHSVGLPGGDRTYVYDLIVKFPAKGNKRAIDGMIANGWHVADRFKQRSEGFHGRVQYDGYAMYVKLCRTLKREMM